MRFGQGPLSTPLLVEAIETLFVPLCVLNNVKAEARILARYKEPAWNNPVVRFFTADGKELIERKDRVWNALALVSRTRRALQRAHVDVPTWFTLLERDLVGARLERTTFAMHCFWEGERRLGALPGVISTEAAWLDGKEVVDVVFDPHVLAFPKLLATAQSQKCLHHVYARTDAQAKAARETVGAGSSGDGATGVRVTRADADSRPAKSADRKFYLKKSRLRFLPLTPAQATKVNAALGLDQDPEVFLSPRQRALGEAVKQALTKQPKALAGLVRPDAVEELGAYQALLVARLAGR